MVSMSKVKKTNLTRSAGIMNDIYNVVNTIRRSNSIIYCSIHQLGTKQSAKVSNDKKETHFACHLTAIIFTNYCDCEKKARLR